MVLCNLNCGCFQVKTFQFKSFQINDFFIIHFQLYICQKSVFQNFKDTENHQIDEDFDIAVELFDNLKLETNELLGHLN